MTIEDVQRAQGLAGLQRLKEDMQHLKSVEPPTIFSDGIITDEVRARTAAGLSLLEDAGGLGIFIEDATGNVGVGMAAPAAMLDIDQPGAAAAIPGLRIDQGNASEPCVLLRGDGADQDIVLIRVDVTGSPTLTWDESENGIAMSDGILFITDQVRARDGDGLALYEDGGAGIFIEDGGQVGIGTTTPQRRLHVVDGAGTVPALFGEGLLIQNNDDAADQAALYIVGGASGFSTVDFGDATSSIMGQMAYDHTNNLLAFRVNNVADRLVIDSSGNVGVGDTAPDFLLDVAGHVRIQGSNRLKLAGTGASDESVDIWGSTAASTFNYVELQTPQSNERTILRIAPNGAPGNPPTALEFYGTDIHADDTNFERLNIRSGSSTYLISTEQSGTGTLRPLQITTTGNTGIVIDTSGNVGIGTSAQFGSGSGAVLGIANAGTNPSSNPTGGGVLYSTGGAGTWRGSSGTITTFGPAEPHCPDCGRDFVHEWKNKKYGHLVLCMWCFSETMTSGVVRRDDAEL